jgi:hypothetical protein
MGGGAGMAASVTGFFASVINIAQIRPSVWAQPEFRQLARSSHVPHGAFGCNSTAEVSSRGSMSGDIPNLQEVRYAR